MTDKINARLIAKFGIDNVLTVPIFAAPLAIIFIVLFLVLGLPLAPYFFSYNIGNPKGQQFIFFSILGLLGLLIGTWIASLWSRELKMIEGEQPTETKSSAATRQAIVDEAEKEQQKYDKFSSLYKRVGNQLYYWKIWKENQEVVTSWGTVGTRGQNRKQATSDYFKTLRTEISKKLKEGYNPLDDNELIDIVVVCKTEGFPPLNKKTNHHYHIKLYAHLEDILRNTGVGKVLSGSMGVARNSKGVFKFNELIPIDINCSVVDVEMAKRVIEDDLRRTEFRDFQIIRVEENEEDNDE